MVFVDAQRYMKVQEDDLSETFRTPKPSFENLNIRPTSFRRHSHSHDSQDPNSNATYTYWRKDGSWWRRWRGVLVPASMAGFVVGLCLVLVVIVIVYAGPASQISLFTLPIPIPGSVSGQGEQGGGGNGWRIDVNGYKVDKEAFNKNLKNQIRIYNLTISEMTVSPTADKHERLMQLINGVFPGPLIQGNIGDLFKINVYNNLSTPTALHLPSHSQNEQDGMIGITQFPILPGTSWCYEFQAIEAGTFMYYGSYGMGIANGLYGPLVIHDFDSEKYQVSEDVVLLLSDWFHSTTNTLSTLNTLNTSASPFNFSSSTADKKPDAILIQGYGNPDWTPTMNALEDRDYRIRIINAGSSTPLNISLQSHTFKVMAADATVVENLGALDSLVIEPGQRYSIIVDFNRAPGAYWLDVHAVDRGSVGSNDAVGSAHGRSSVVGVSNRMRVQYGETARTFDDFPRLTKPLNTTALKPVLTSSSSSSPLPATTHDPQTLILEISGNATHSSFNQTTYIPSTTPLLVTLIQNPPSQNGLTDMFGAGVLAYSVMSGETVNLVIRNRAPRGLGITLHGHRLTILDPGFGSFEPSANPASQSQTQVEAGQMDHRRDNERNMERDVVTVEKGGYKVLQITAGTPGVWALHTTDLWYREAGALMVLAVRDPGNVTIIL